MAGHSKWANIKRKKAGVDAARSKVFTRIIRELTIAARLGGGDPAGNPRLSLAIDNAKSNNMPKDNIERAIKKGTGELDDGQRLEEVTYEGYGPGGVAYFVEATTDNPNRTVGEVRHIFSRFGGNMGTSGSVAYLFDQKGSITVPAEGVDKDELMLEAIDAGAEDIIDDDPDLLEVSTKREDLYAVRNHLESKGYTIQNAELQWVPKTEVKLDEKAAISNFKLMNMLEENDDVGQVSNNIQMDEETISIAESM
ncbi:YebC/PmpR family DNA-binding transcriptional regulator [Balneolaceae bacterium ANBcel3]|nr:YebC/PmpR family DNA-binding transcriptional regulator [Balneolaceae bacterium ANBcel3]